MVNFVRKSVEGFNTAFIIYDLENLNKTGIFWNSLAESSQGMLGK